MIELMLVMIIVAVLSSLALPNFFGMSTDAKNAATQGALGGMRSAIDVAVVAIAVKEAQGTPHYPTYNEFSSNAFNASHPKLSGQAILDPSAGIPKNQWTDVSAPVSTQNKIYDCSALVKGGLLALPNNNRGWCYNTATGQIWANSNLNGSATTENNY